MSSSRTPTRSIRGRRLAAPKSCWISKTKITAVAAFHVAISKDISGVLAPTILGKPKRRDDDTATCWKSCQSPSRQTNDAAASNVTSRPDTVRFLVGAALFVVVQPAAFATDSRG